MQRSSLRASASDVPLARKVSRKAAARRWKRGGLCKAVTGDPLHNRLLSRHEIPDVPLYAFQEACARDGVCGPRSEGLNGDDGIAFWKQDLVHGQVTFYLSILGRDMPTQNLLLCCRTCVKGYCNLYCGFAAERTCEVVRPTDTVK